MNIEDLTTLLRTEIEKTGIKCYTPDLPQTDEMCAAISLGDGDNVRVINDYFLYSEIPFYVLVRGTLNDKETRRLSDSIFKKMDMEENIVFNNTRIILITCKTPNYAFRDENQRIYYNINCSVKVEWRNV